MQTSPEAQADYIIIGAGSAGASAVDAALAATASCKRDIAGLQTQFDDSSALLQKLDGASALLSRQRREHQCQRKGSLRPVTEQDLAHIRIYERQFVVGRVFGNIGVGPETVRRSILAGGGALEASYVILRAASVAGHAAKTLA